MKSWNLSHFNDLTPNVLSSVDKNASVAVSSMPRRRTTAPITTIAEAVVGTVVFVAAISLTSLQVNVCAAMTRYVCLPLATISNIHNDRPPLMLIFGANHALKWDAAKEEEMLTRAAASVAKSNDSDNEANLIHAVLRENLPSDRKEAVDLASLGIKLS